MKGSERMLVPSLSQMYEYDVFNVITRNALRCTTDLFSAGRETIQNMDLFA